MFDTERKINEATFLDEWKSCFLTIRLIMTERPLKFQLLKN